MTRQQTRARRTKTPREAVVWIDHDRAVIVGHGPDGQDSVAIVDRLPAETESTFDIRTVDETVNEDRVVVSGPAYARTGFERAYVAMTHRPDRIVDVEPTTPHESFIHRTI
jgi:xanthine/CO dehydrogenase XdhC/CoxF family maturation factor